MAKNMAFRIKVEMVETEVEPPSDRQPQEQADGAFCLVLPEADEVNISALDREALDVSFPALREALSRHLAQAGKKLQCQAERRSVGVELREQVDAYRVEGEVGRFCFSLYEAVDAGGNVVCRGTDTFPRRQPREGHKTEGFREEALCLEASRRSYRDNAAPLNRYRRQPQGGTPVTTLQDNAQQEGTRVLNFLERQSQSLLQAHGFNAQGHPSAARVAEVARGGIRAGGQRRWNPPSGRCAERWPPAGCHLRRSPPCERRPLRRSVKTRPVALITWISSVCAMSCPSTPAACHTSTSARRRCPAVSSCSSRVFRSSISARQGLRTVKSRGMGALPQKEQSKFLISINN